jgi:hypothetical protein
MTWTIDNEKAGSNLVIKGGKAYLVMGDEETLVTAGLSPRSYSYTVGIARRWCTRFDDLVAILGVTQ